jgi:hypothetical protein
MAHQRLSHGVLVWEDSEGEAGRIKGCLCMGFGSKPRCARLVLEEDVAPLVPTVFEGVDAISVSARVDKINTLKKAFNCPVAQRNYELCVEAGIAAGVSRCPMYVPRIDLTQLVEDQSV